MTTESEEPRFPPLKAGMKNSPSPSDGAMLQTLAKTETEGLINTQSLITKYPNFQALIKDHSSYKELSKPQLEWKKKKK